MTFLSPSADRFVDKVFSPSGISAVPFFSFSIPGCKKFFLFSNVNAPHFLFTYGGGPPLG